jgi:hypothetical protein
MMLPVLQGFDPHDWHLEIHQSQPEFKWRQNQKNYCLLGTSKWLKPLPYKGHYFRIYLPLE